MYIQQLREMVPPATVAVCNQITLLILCSVSTRPVILPKVTDAPTQVSDTLALTVKFHNLSFQIFLLFVPEMSSLTSYIFLIIKIVLVWIL